MAESSVISRRAVLSLAAALEIGIGLALMIVPAIVVALLLGADFAGEPTTVARFLGIALLALGLACWPGCQGVEREVPSSRAMLTYNALVAAFLAYVGTVEGQGGILLWPTVVLHTVVALLLIYTWRTERQSGTIDE